MCRLVVVMGNERWQWKKEGGYLGLGMEFKYCVREDSRVLVGICGVVG